MTEGVTKVGFYERLSNDEIMKLGRETMEDTKIRVMDAQRTYRVYREQLLRLADLMDKAVTGGELFDYFKAAQIAGKMKETLKQGRKSVEMMSNFLTRTTAEYFASFQAAGVSKEELEERLHGLNIDELAEYAAKICKED